MSSVDWVPELAAALDRLVPRDEGSLPNWDDVVTRVGRERTSVRRWQRPHGLRLALVIALLFLLLTGVATATYLLTRDNGSLVFQGRFGQLLAVDPNGPVLRTIEPCAHGRPTCAIAEPAWSPDGTRLAFVRGLGGAPTDKSHMFLYVANADGGDLRRLASCGSCGEKWDSRFGWHSRLAWSPDSRQITFSRDDARGPHQSLWTISAAGGTPRRLADCRGPCVDSQPAWSPNGRVLAFIRAAGLYTSGLYTIHTDGSGLNKIARDAVNEPTWSPDGSSIAFGRPGGFAVADATGIGDRLYFAGTHNTGVIATRPAWSPDGSKFVFFKTPGRLGHFRVEVWTMNVDGSDLTRLYRSGCCTHTEASPIWSPDGRMIAFSADSAGGTFVMNADGTGLRRLSSVTADVMSWQPLPKGKRQ